MKLGGLVRVAVAVAMVPLLCSASALAWGRDGHIIINRLAVLNLPKDVPAFLRNGSAADMMAYLGPEPDQWKTPQAAVELSSEQTPDHFIDLEWANLVAPLPKKRYDFIRALDAAQTKNPKIKMTPENIGMQPWQVEEVYQRLKVGMWEYRKAVAANLDTKPAESAIVFYAGWLGHYVADGSQPLHVTIQYNGWTGENPHGYTTEHKIHAQFESIYVKANLKEADVQPLVAAAAPKLLNDQWSDYLAYLQASNGYVEKLYQVQKAGGFTDAGTAEGKAFTEERLAAGAIELRDMIYTAWVRSGDPVEEYKGPQ
ncbi:MAG: hypothetical protein JWM43_3217 [Acidobacteriaceae bacterium]|nr:hypothetical protein [Acidobacteriaceae bacterium]